MIEYRPTDDLVYREELRYWLPPSVFDFHAHVSLGQHRVPLSPERLRANWAMEVGVRQPWERLRDVYATLFPENEVLCLVFGGVFQELDIDAENSYVLSGLGRPENTARGLYVTRPSFDPSRIHKAMDEGFAGIKPYPDLAPEQQDDCSVFDFLPTAHLEALNEREGVLMLHLSRPGRIGDPDNIREVLQISDQFPRVRIVLAHVGRAFCLPTAQKGLPSFADHPRILFDCSANLNPDVFAYFLEVLGPDRLLFGSDLPITLMRGCRDHVGERYINYSDAPYSWNTDRKSPEQEARYTFFLYEELRALIAGARRAGMGKPELESILYGNAARVLGIGEHDV